MKLSYFIKSKKPEILRYHCLYTTEKGNNIVSQTMTHHYVYIPISETLKFEKNLS